MPFLAPGSFDVTVREGYLRFRNRRQKEAKNLLDPRVTISR